MGSQQISESEPTASIHFCKRKKKEQVMVEDYEQYTAWFKLYQDTCERCNIPPEDRYNMDKKGFAMGFLGMFCVICSKHEKDIAIAEAQNREWTIFIKCVSSDSFLLFLWYIFKGKQHMKACYDV